MPTTTARQESIDVPPRTSKDTEKRLVCAEQSPLLREQNHKILRTTKNVLNAASASLLSRDMHLTRRSSATTPACASGSIFWQTTPRFRWNVWAAELLAAALGGFSSSRRVLYSLKLVIVHAIVALFLHVDQIEKVMISNELNLMAIEEHTHLLHD